VKTDGEWIVSYEKGTQDRAFDHIDYGALAFRRDVVLALPPSTKRGLEVLQHDLAAQKRLRAYVAHARFFEIGSPEGLSTLESELRKET
jgi:hypothetical protein